MNHSSHIDALDVEKAVNTSTREDDAPPPYTPNVLTRLSARNTVVQRRTVAVFDSASQSFRLIKVVIFIILVGALVGTVSLVFGHRMLVAKDYTHGKTYAASAAAGALGGAIFSAGLTIPLLLKHLQGNVDAVEVVASFVAHSILDVASVAIFGAITGVVGVSVLRQISTELGAQAMSNSHAAGAACLGVSLAPSSWRLRRAWFPAVPGTPIDI